MAKTRLIMLPQFGVALESLRRERRLSMGEVITAMHRRHQSLGGFSIGQLSRYETGRTKYPDWAAVFHLTNFYRPVTEEAEKTMITLLALFAEDREKWAEHEMIQSTRHQGGSRDAASGTGLVAPTIAEETRVLRALAYDLSPTSREEARRSRAATPGRKRTPGKGRR